MKQNFLVDPIVLAVDLKWSKHRYHIYDIITHKLSKVAVILRKIRHAICTG